MGAKKKKQVLKENKEHSGELHINPMDLFNKPREAGDMDLILMVRLNIDALAGDDKRHGEAFSKLPDIAYNLKSNPVVQRLVINRVLVNRLLVFRSRSDISVNGVLPFIANDGYLEDWLTLLKEMVLPFCVKHSVFLEKPDKE